MINFRMIKSNDNDFIKLYYKAYSWDKKHVCFQTKDVDLLALFNSCYVLYEQENIIGYGIIEYNISMNNNIEIKPYLDDEYQEQEEPDKIILPPEPNKLTLAYIINPDYRRQGYGGKLVEYLIQEAEKRKNYDLIEVKILKENIASISLIEKYDFEFKYFDKKSIVFQKSIKK